MIRQLNEETAVERKSIETGGTKQAGNLETGRMFALYSQAGERSAACGV
jgi:hypothetical protein